MMEYWNNQLSFWDLSLASLPRERAEGLAARRLFDKVAGDVVIRGDRLEWGVDLRADPLGVRAPRVEPAARRRIQ